MTRIQEDIIDGFDPSFEIIDYKYYSDINRDYIELYAEYKDTIRKYIISPDGETRMTQYSKAPSETLLCKYSMEEHDWAVTEFASNEEETGDVPFDVVVENEIKKEKENKKMIRVDDIIANVLSDVVGDYVRENSSDIRDDLETAIEEKAREKAYEAIERKMSYVLEDLAEECVDNNFDDDMIDTDMLAEALSDCGIID